MKRILPAVCLAFAVAVAANAQSTSPTTQQQPTDRTQDQSQMRSGQKSVTLTGCVRQGDESNTFVLANVDASELNRATSGQPGAHTGTTAGTETGTQPGTTTSGTGTTGSPAGTTGDATAGSRMGRDAANEVQLVGAGNVNLREHVGHRVRVTGTMVPPGMDSDRSRQQSGQTGTSAGSSTGTAGTPASGDTTARSGYGREGGDKDKKAKHKVNVQSVQMISENCQ